MLALFKQKVVDFITEVVMLIHFIIGPLKCNLNRETFGGKSFLFSFIRKNSVFLSVLQEGFRLGGKLGGIKLRRSCGDNVPIAPKITISVFTVYTTFFFLSFSPKR